MREMSTRRGVENPWRASRERKQGRDWRGRDKTRGRGLKATTLCCACELVLGHVSTTTSTTSAKALQAEDRRMRRHSARRTRLAWLSWLTALRLEALALAVRQGSASNAVALAVLLESGRRVVAGCSSLLTRLARLSRLSGLARVRLLPERVADRCLGGKVDRGRSGAERPADAGLAWLSGLSGLSSRLSRLSRLALREATVAKGRSREGRSTSACTRGAALSVLSLVSVGHWR